MGISLSGIPAALDVMVSGRGDASGASAGLAMFGSRLTAPCEDWRGDQVSQHVGRLEVAVESLVGFLGALGVESRAVGLTRLRT